MMAEETDQWVLVEGILEECWPGEWTTRTGPSYRLMLSEYQPALVLVALKHLARGGGRFRPSVSEILEVLERDPGRPSWPEVFEAIFGRDGVLAVSPYQPGWEEGENHRRRLWEEAVLARAAEQHPFIESFVSVAGPESLRDMGIGDEQFGRARKEMLRKEYLAFEEVAVERTARGIPLSAGGRSRELRGMQPLAVMGLTPPTRELGRG